MSTHGWASRSVDHLGRVRFSALDPPPHVPAEVDAAWERARALVAGELELHFAVSSSGRASGELRALGAGKAWTRLSASEALMLACGDFTLVPGALAA